MHAVTLDANVLAELKGKTAVVTGAVGGIGASTVEALAANGCNVVLADLEYAQSAAEAIIASLPSPKLALFVPTDILDWKQMTVLFHKAREQFGSIDIVIANAGVMESQVVLDMDQVDVDGNLMESREYFKVLDINVKGTMNTLRQALFHMKDNTPRFSDGSRGSIVLTISTSGYFGATGNAGYISTKHAITGILRASQVTAKKYNVRINGVSPFCTVTNMMKQFKDPWLEAGLPLNTPEMVANVMVHTAADPLQKGSSFLVAGPILREIEHPLKVLIPEWLGQDLADLMSKAGDFFVGLGGFPLPRLSTIVAPN